VTDPNGDYTLDSLEPGDNKSFSFSFNGLLPADRTVNLSGRETRLDVQLSGGLTVTGQVVSDAGVPLPDADVRAFSAATGSTPKASRTDSGGTFTFDAMAPGHYTFNASKQGFTDGQLTDFDISGGAAPRVVLKSGGVLFGHVSGVADTDLSKVTITARSSAGASEAVLDGGGNYRMEGAPTGTLRVSATLMRAFNDARSTDVKSVDLAAGGSAQLDLEFTGDTTIRGHITRNGLPAANSTIQFSPRGGGARASSPTDDGGNYTVSGLSDGDYAVTVVDMQRFNAYATTYSVHGSGNFDIDIKSSSLRGHVIDRGDSTPISGANVHLRRQDNQSAVSNLAAQSDDSGGFLIDGVVTGSYTVSADKDGYGNVVKDISVTDVAPQDVMLDLARTDGITLRVVDGRNGQTLNPNVAVYDAQNRPVYNTLRFGFGGGSDSERIPLAAGQYRAVIAANGYAPKTVTLASPSSQTVPLTPGGSVVLHSKTAATRRALLIDADGTPYTRPYSTDPSFLVPIGDTRLPNVAPGPYTLQIIGPNGAVVSTQPVVVVDGQEIAVDVG
jgi:Carboxypeptidase regulatory-like domain